MAGSMKVCMCWAVRTVLCGVRCGVTRRRRSRVERRVGSSGQGHRQEQSRRRIVSTTRSTSKREREKEQERASDRTARLPAGRSHWSRRVELSAAPPSPPPWHTTQVNNYWRWHHCRSQKKYIQLIYKFIIISNANPAAPAPYDLLYTHHPSLFKF